MSGHINESIGDIKTAPNSPSVYDNYLDSGTGHFANLVPLNDPAKRAYHDVALLKLQGKLPYHEQYLHIEGESNKPTRNIDSSSVSDSGPHAGVGGDIKTLKSTHTERSLTGFYKLSLTILPEHPLLGWRFGKGKSNRSNLGVDLLLMPPESAGDNVAGVHGRLAWRSSSAGFFVIADNLKGKPVLMNGECLVHKERVISNENMIVVGSLAYKIEYL
jgi:hypothetical protein